MSLHQHGLNRSLIMRLREAFPAAKVDLVFDGYKMPEVRPLITIESMPGNFDRITKLREGVRMTYRFQIGLHDVNSVQLSINQERMQRLFNFERFDFYNTLTEPPELVGFFDVELTAVTPMPASDISKKSEYNRVYFDVEIRDIKRRC